MSSSKQIWVWIGVVVVVIIVVIALVVALRPSPPAARPMPVFAPQGQLTPGFPKELVLDPQAQVNNSYSINYSSSTNQYTAEWVSSSSLVTLYGNYKTYFGQSGWTITNSSDVVAGSKLGVLYAATSSAKVNVTLVSQKSGSDVTVTYVAQ
jgi:hypothetical protein